MKKNIFILLLTISLVLVLKPPSLASSNPLFGPNKYARTTGPPNTYTDTFQACSTGAVYNLIIENGELGKDRISSGIVSLNNKEIVKQNEFNQQIDKIQKTVFLQKENTLNIKLASGPNGFIKVSIYCSTGCLELKINSPTTGTTINKAKTIIQGNLKNVYGETGITIKTSGANGEISGLAQTQKTEFAGQIPLQQGQNTITAQAADACGYKTQDAITISTETLQENIRLTAIPSSGIPIFNATLEAEANIQNPVSKYSWDINGDGTIEYSGTDSKVQGQYQQTGLYFPKVTITDTKGNTYEETTIVNVLSKEEMDALLKTKWEGMWTTLVNKNVEKGLNYLIEPSREIYQQAFNIIIDELPQIIADMQNIELIYLVDDVAKYRINRTHDIDGTLQTVTYYIYFVRDSDGIWKIDRF